MFSSWWVMVFILILLICFGFVVYYYLAKGVVPSTSDMFSDILTYAKRLFSYDSLGGSAESENNEDSSDDADKNSENGDGQEKPAEKTAEEVPNTASLSKITPSNNEVRPPDNAQQNALNRALNATKPQESPKQDYVANDSYASKSGWCYIGSEQGYRSCSQVGETDTCMSGNIFPTQDICVNPNLRA
jgi:hypothetical protein